MTELIDIGANLLNHQFQNDRDTVIKRALASGVHTIILTGVSVENSRRSLQLAASQPQTLYSTAGIHPHNAKEYTPQALSALREIAQQPRVVAVGECGLDFDRDFSPRPKQEECFIAQVELSIELQKPLFLHERSAFERFCSIIQPYIPRIPKAVVHCFTGSLEQAQAYIDMGLYIGLTGAICDERKSHLRGVVQAIPPDRLMIETDAPFMIPRTIYPKPNHRRNEPAFLRYVAAAVAHYTGRSEEEVSQQTTAVTREFFGLE